MTPDLQQKLVAWRQHLRAHPELSLQEKATSAFVQERLAELGIAFEAGIGGHRIVATLSRGYAGARVGLRADMDALPITEDTGLPYASRNPGIMHACGHDGHTVSLLGAAALLAAETNWSGIVDFVFQPAEVSRNVDPNDTAVLSLCTIAGGTAPNQVAGRAVNRGTPRNHRVLVFSLGILTVS